MIPVNYHNSPILSLFLHRLKCPTITGCQSLKCLWWVLVNCNFINFLKIGVFCQKCLCQIFLLCQPVMSYKLRGISKLSILKSCIRFTDLFPGKSIQKTVNKCNNPTTYMYKIIANTIHIWMWHKHAVKHDIFFYTWMNGSYWKIAFTNCGLSSPHFWRGRGSGHVFCVRGHGVILLDRRLHTDVYKPGDRQPTERLFIAGVLQGIGDPANVSPHLVQLLHTQRKKNKERLSALLFHWQCCLHFKVSLKAKGCFLKVDSIKMQITAFSVRNAVFSSHKRRKNFPNKHHKAFQSIKAHHTKASKGGHRKLAVKSWRGMTVTNVIIYFVSSSSVHQSQHVRAELYILLLFSVQERNER